MPKRKQTTKLCYVIMPFSKTKACSEEEWTDIFESIIKPAVEGAALGYQCLRSEATTGNIIRKVVNSLYQANVVIADLTDRNPNVFYELGVRHTLKNRTIMIAQRRKDIPSDLHGYASHVYKWKTTAQKGELTKKLRRLFEHIEKDTDRSDNPVSDFLHQRSIPILEYQREESARKIRALLMELDRVSRILSAAISVGKGEERERTVQVVRQSCPALDHLISTQYVYNELFSFQAGSVRASIEAIGGLVLPPKSIESTVDSIRILEGNAKRLLKAYEAGDSLEDLPLEEWKYPSDS